MNTYIKNAMRQEMIRNAMSSEKINRVQLSKKMQICYPTMLTKIKQPDTLRF